MYTNIVSVLVNATVGNNSLLTSTYYIYVYLK